jgi:tetratricopeptide (TPR) repeat protein
MRRPLSNPFVFFALALILCGLPRAGSAQETSPDARTRAHVLEVEGMRSYIQGNHAQAIAYWEAAIAHEPSGALYQNLARAYFAVGELDASRRALELAGTQTARPLDPRGKEENRRLLADLERARAKQEPLLTIDETPSRRMLTLDEIESHDELGTEALFENQERNARNELRRARIARMHAEAARTSAEAELIYKDAADLRARRVEQPAPAAEQVTLESARDTKGNPSLFYAGVGSATFGTIGLGTALYLNNRVRQTTNHPDFYESEALVQSARRDRNVGLGALVVGAGMIALGATLIYYERTLRVGSSDASTSLRFSPTGVGFSHTF